MLKWNCFRLIFWLRTQDDRFQILLHFEVRLQTTYVGLAKELPTVGYKSVEVVRNLEIKRRIL